MTDEELIREFIRVERDFSGASVSVKKITWDDPHRPASEWVPARTLTRNVSETELLKVLEGILADEAFFARCLECGERNPRGWMHSATLCRVCAERNHGVV